jgi:16S rRNA pseudouridine516 synthase
MSNPKKAPRGGRIGIAAVLYGQGFGSRRECVSRVLSGIVSVAGRVCDDPEEIFDTEGLVFNVDGRDWPWREHALVLLHKPAGYECSAKPKHHPSVMSLLPMPLRVRGVQPVGRLDEDTTGLLLLTDDGALIHRLTSPKKHVPKVYEVSCKHPVDARQLRALLDGVVLDDEPVLVRAAACELTGPGAAEGGASHTLRLTLTEGKYHQVKRMVAAAGNRVEALHRSAFGAVTIPADVAPGEWCWLASDTVF